MLMNLWKHIPEFLLPFNFIVELSFLMLLFYLYVFYVAVKYAGERKRLIGFLLLTFVSTVTMFNNLGPGANFFIPPLLLLCVMVMPVIMMMIHLYRKAYNIVWIWLFVSIAGWLFSLCWTTWLFIAAGS